MVLGEHSVAKQITQPLVHLIPSTAGVSNRNKNIAISYPLQLENRRQPEPVTLEEVDNKTLVNRGSSPDSIIVLVASNSKQTMSSQSIRQNHTRLQSL